MTPSDDRPAPAAPGRSEPHEDRWIETPRGGLFFINSLFVFPYLMVLVPLLTRLFVRGVVGGLPGESTILDTFPLLAEYLAPRYGWLAALPIVLVVKNLGMEPQRLPRTVLWSLLLLHAAVLVWTLTGWAGLHGFDLPGGPAGS
ncbi:MAG: hypothetical protein EA351_06635 [Gemmatimonadales bacterium]|nr:MAG: hypothetical protein EA351_06635 [Gemmatimonadales bacterium]